MTLMNIQSWAVDLATIGPIYPMVGTEFILWILGMAFWIYWHVWQGRHEKRTYDEDMEHLDTPEKLEKAMKTGRIE